MKNITLRFLFISTIVFANTICLAETGLDACIQSIKTLKPGFIIKLEKLNMNGKGVYEIEIGDVNKGEWEFLCEADSGKIIEKEAEVTNPNSPAFKKNAKLSEDEASKIALKAYPGKIEEVEYEVEDNGGSSYEFDIVGKNGVETKVEVDAASGKIIETAIEDWEAGEETDEKR
jgi:uncharacterized membrane protein YkoI